jgi:CRP-like cAMP-binding protein
MLMQKTSQIVEPKNLFLQKLSRDDRELIEGRLERCHVERGEMLFSSEETLDAIYFPESVIVSIEKDGGNCPHIETAVVGNEGLVGWSAFTGVARSTHNAIVQMRSGTVLRISARDIAVACALSKTLLQALMCFIEIVLVQMGQAIISHLRDSVERRVCRWLLMRHDRVPSDHLLVKHEDIGANLGVRRASVTDCLHILEGDRLIRCFRGRIIIKDRKGLEDRAADSYGTAEDHYRALIGPFGRLHGVPTAAGI